MEPLLDLHTPRTSATLQERHADVYRGLFAKCETVVSVPLAVSLTGDRTYTDRAAGIVMQLPRRVWVGIEHGAQSSVQEYDIVRDRFTTASSLLHARVAEVAIELLEPGDGFRVLIETQAGRSMAVTGAFAAAGVLAAHVSCGGTADPAETSLLVDRARGVHGKLCSGRVLGTSIVSALGTALAQFVAFDGARPVASAAREKEWPVDFVVLATGSRNDLGSPPESLVDDAITIAFLAAQAARLTTTAPFVRPIIGTAHDASTALHDRYYLDHVRAWICLWEMCDSKAVDEVLAVMRRRLSLVRATEALHPSLECALDALPYACASARYAAYPLGTSAQGSAILLVSPSGELRAHLESLPGEIEYVSWRDGITALRPRIEQSIAAGTIHPTLGTSVEQRLTATHAGVSRGIRPTDEADEPDTDVVIDTRTEKMRVAGRDVRAGELPSQRMTIALLRKLIDAPTRSISNDQLPRSTYRDSRSELVSKIIGPFCRVVRERTGRAFEIHTRGTASAYTITLDLGDLSLCVREPIPVVA